MSLNLDAKSAAIGAGVAYVATQFFGSTKKSKGTAGLGKPARKRKSSGTSTKKASTKKAGAKKK